MKKALSIFLLLVSTYAIAAASDSAITVLKALENDSYADIVELLGPPADKSGYSVAQAPTKSWHHGELFTLYPKNEGNDQVQIMEVVWKDGDSGIYACFHIVDGVNVCIVAKRIHHSVKF